METLKLELEYNGKSYEVVEKQSHEIEDCEEGKFVTLIFKNSEEYSGLFRGMDGDDIMLGSVSSGRRIGLPVRFLKYYFEQT